MSGLAYKKDALAIKADKMVRVLRGGNIGEEQFYFKGDDVFISSELVKPELYLRKNYMITPAVSSLDHIGKIALIDKDYSDTVVGGFVLMLIPHFNDDVVSEYLLYAFAAKHHRDNCRNITHKSGQAFYNLSREQMMNLPVPLPPREEMGRIIAMLKRVLPRVADYAVVDTALQNLNGSFPEALKKSILQEAVQGKLVPQDPSDEPAEALLERIRAEKQRLIKEGKIKKDKHESIIFRRDNSHYEKLDGVERCIDDELPFEIPENWCWVRFETALVNRDAERIPLSVAQREKLEKKYDYYGASGVIDKVDQYLFDKPLLLIGEDGANLLLRSKPIAFIATGKYWVNNHAHVIDTVGGVDLHYIALFINATNLAPYVTGTAQPKMNQERLNSILVPLPPSAEQRRIVTAFEEIAAIIQQF